MLLAVQVRSKYPANSSATSGFFIDFDICDDFEVGRYIWAFFAILCVAVGFPASLAILWDMFKMCRRETPFTPNDFFIVNLLTIDFVFLTFIPPGLWNYFHLKKLVFDAIWNGVYALNTCGRPLLMACVCVDCYLAVVHPITYRKRKNWTLRILMVGIVWTWSLVYGIATGIFSHLLTSVFPIVPAVIAIAIIVPCDSFIVYTLIKSDPNRKNIHPQKQRAIQTLINSMVMALILYLPPVLMFTVGKHVIRDPTTFVCTIAIPITITSTFGSAVMPVLYLNNLGKLGCFRLGSCGKT